MSWESTKKSAREEDQVSIRKVVTTKGRPLLERYRCKVSGRSDLRGRSAKHANRGLNSRKRRGMPQKLVDLLTILPNKAET